MVSSSIAQELTDKILPSKPEWGNNLTSSSNDAEVPEGLSEFMESAWGTSEDFWSRAKRDAELRDREKQERLKAAELLHHVWLYDDEEDSRAAVDASDKYSYYASGRARLDRRMLPIYGRDYAEAVMPNVADDPCACIEEYLRGMSDERRKAKYKAEFKHFKARSGKEKNDYYGLLGRMIRDEVREQYAEKQRLISAIQSTLNITKSAITWQDYISLVEKQETQYSQKLTDSQKRNIYEEWLKCVQKEQKRSKFEEENRKAREKEERLKTLGILAGCILGLLFAFIMYRKRHIIYRSIYPSLNPFSIIICALLVIALFKMPYGYYQFMHIAITIWGIIYLSKAYQHTRESAKKTCALLITGAITILYNPILPINLDREIWSPLSIISIPLIFLIPILLKSANNNTEKKPQCSNNKLKDEKISSDRKYDIPQADTPKLSYFYSWLILVACWIFFCVIIAFISTIIFHVKPSGILTVILVVLPSFIARYFIVKSIEKRMLKKKQAETNKRDHASSINSN